jgi:hypothetical protein
VTLHCLTTLALTLFFSTVADKIGQNVVYDPSTHPSIVEIKNRVDIDNNFDFQNITAERVSFMILLFTQRIIFCSPELHFLEKKGLIVVQKLQVLAPPEQRSKK